MKFDIVMSHHKTARGTAPWELQAKLIVTLSSRIAVWEAAGHELMWLSDVDELLWFSPM